MKYYSNHCCLLRAIVLWVLLSGCLSACSSPFIVSDIEEYQQRLERVLDIELASTTEPNRSSQHLAYPPRDSLLKQPTPIDINLTQFHRLQQCKLGNLVAEHNTALGKIQHFSQRLQYEQRFINALEACIAHTRQAEPATSSVAQLADTMTQWQPIKQTEYALHWSNMLVLSDETKAAFSRASPALLYQDSIDVSGQVSLFKELTRLADYHYQPSASIEASLQVIGAARLPATIWLTQQHIAAQLPGITQGLKTHLNQLDCLTTDAEQANILRNVFYLFFIEKIQPVGARINQFTYQFAPVMDNWLESPVLPDSFKHFLRSHQQQFSAYQQAMAEHVALWQDFLGRCDLSPVAPTSA